MAHRSALRASDAERDLVADHLRRAAAEGRLQTDELEQRVEAALTARTYGQLERLLDDLPAPPAAPAPPARQTSSLARPALVFLAVVVLAFALLSGDAARLVFGFMATWWIWLGVAWFFFVRPARRARRAQVVRYRGRGGICRGRRVGIHHSRTYWYWA